MHAILGCAHFNALKLALNLILSLLMLALCLWLVWPNAHNRTEIAQAFSALRHRDFLPYLTAYLALLAATHFFRAWRWNNLLSPIGATLSPGKLLAISSVGFMAILALPARLGEFVRPALLRKRGKISASAVLGTVAVERIVDGLLVSILVFVCCFARQGEHAPRWMMPMAYASLGGFVLAMSFLACALKWPEPAVRLSVRITLLPWLAPLTAAKLETVVHRLISGFLVLKDGRNLAMFGFWSALYWLCNGLGMWILARGMGLELSVVGAFATMGIVAVGITLPNSPGLVGQFHWLTTKGLSLYLPEAVASSTGLAYAIVLHGIQVVWYLGAGALSLVVSHTTLGEALSTDEELSVSSQ